MKALHQEKRKISSNRSKDGSNPMIKAMFSPSSLYGSGDGAKIEASKLLPDRLPGIAGTSREESLRSALESLLKSTIARDVFVALKEGVRIDDQDSPLYKRFLSYYTNTPAASYEELASASVFKDEGALFDGMASLIDMRFNYISFRPLACLGDAGGDRWLYVKPLFGSACILRPSSPTSRIAAKIEPLIEPPGTSSLEPEEYRYAGMLARGFSDAAVLHYAAPIAHVRNLVSYADPIAEVFDSIAPESYANNIAFVGEVDGDVVLFSISDSSMPMMVQVSIMLAREEGRLKSLKELKAVFHKDDLERYAARHKRRLIEAFDHRSDNRVSTSENIYGDNACFAILAGDEIIHVGEGRLNVVRIEGRGDAKLEEASEAGMAAAFFSGQGLGLMKALMDEVGGSVDLALTP